MNFFARHTFKRLPTFQYTPTLLRSTAAVWLSYKVCHKATRTVSCSSISEDYDEHIHIIEHNRFPFWNNQPFSQPFPQPFSLSQAELDDRANATKVDRRKRILFKCRRELMTPKLYQFDAILLMPPEMQQLMTSILIEFHLPSLSLSLHWRPFVGYSKVRKSVLMGWQ